MVNYSSFDILGPIMIGPSSSHTAGAARLGKVARYIAGDNFNKVKFFLHGSFAKTYKGHGTDKALAAGVLGMEPFDDNLPKSLDIAKDLGYDFIFYETELEYEHPNTAKIVFTENNNEISVTGSSIGGGSIVITNIDGYDVNLTGEYPTIFIRHNDKKGIISEVTTVLAGFEINVAKMQVNRKNKGKFASMVIETDDSLPKSMLALLKGLEDVLTVRAINPVKEGDINV
ncbi:MAG: L-serine ammonia-lyase, iron-sulfur-dependent, subunit beta [Firmicutes bacterium]|nr:L-serine ammonia-lyase, iron-sulfur-dependent, subunit beta [Bacillota bacterium]